MSLNENSESMIREKDELQSATFAFAEWLSDMKRKTGKGMELISLYIPPDKQILDVIAHIRYEHGQAANIKSNSTRMNVQGELELVLARLKYYSRPPENGVVIFCGTLDFGGHRTLLDMAVIEPHKPITSYEYHCDSSFYLDPLEDMLKDNVFVVAASDSLHPERADYVCDGVDDQDTIQAAIDALPDNGSTVSDVGNQDPLVVSDKYLFDLCNRIVEDPNTLAMRLLNGGVDLDELFTDKDD